MRIRLLVFGVGLVLGIQPAAAHDICGEAPTISDSKMREGIAGVLLAFRFSSMSGESFARLAAERYRAIADGRPPHEARAIAVALLQAKCVDLLRNADPARLPWHFKDRLVQLAKLVPDFREAHAVLERIAAAEARR